MKIERKLIIIMSLLSFVFGINALRAMRTVPINFADISQVKRNGEVYVGYDNSGNARIYAERTNDPKQPYVINVDGQIFYHDDANQWYSFLAQQYNGIRAS